MIGPTPLSLPLLMASPSREGPPGGPGCHIFTISSLACHTQEEIAEKEGLTKQAINLVCQEMAELGGVSV
jgi:hypothetical protein